MSCFYAFELYIKIIIRIGSTYMIMYLAGLNIYSSGLNLCPKHLHIYAVSKLKYRE